MLSGALPQIAHGLGGHGKMLRGADSLFSSTWLPSPSSSSRETRNASFQPRAGWLLIPPGVNLHPELFSDSGQRAGRERAARPQQIRALSGSSRGDAAPLLLTRWAASGCRLLMLIAVIMVFSPWCTAVNYFCVGLQLSSSPDLRRLQR